jgi:hypothetical protein
MKTHHTVMAVAAATLLAACGIAAERAPAPAGHAMAAMPAAPAAPAVPAAIATAPDQALALTVAARGVQIYECRLAAAKKPGDDLYEQHEWTFVAPEAALRDAQGRVVGRHGAGPHWTFDDGTRATGRVLARAEASEEGAIPWLLLESSASGPGLAHLRSIQRIHTTGGLAPGQPCRAGEAGTRLRVPYTADYLFYSAR